MRLRTKREHTCIDAPSNNFVKRCFSRRLRLVQPTYLHKHDAPLCFPFSLRAPALHLLEKMREREAGAGPEGRRSWVAKKRSRVESRQPNFVTLASRYFDVSRTGQGRPRFFTNEVSVVLNDSDHGADISLSRFPRIPSEIFASKLHFPAAPINICQLTRYQISIVASQFWILTI